MVKTWQFKVITIIEGKNLPIESQFIKIMGNVMTLDPFPDIPDKTAVLRVLVKKSVIAILSKLEITQSINFINYSSKKRSLIPKINSSDFRLGYMVVW